jgi:hypothetical protein
MNKPGVFYFRLKLSIKDEEGFIVQLKMLIYYFYLT